MSRVLKIGVNVSFFRVLIVNLEMREIGGTAAQIEFSKNGGNERARDKVRPMSVTWR